MDVARLRRLLSVSITGVVVACGGPGASSTSDADTTTDATTDATTDEAETTDTDDPDACGDGEVEGLEQCEPGGAVPCGDDCTLPDDGPGSLEWVWVDDVSGEARAITVDEMGRATAAGYRERSTVDAWVGRFAPDGSPGWTVEYDGAAAGSDLANDVSLDDQGRVIVAGDEGTGGMYPDAWIAVYDDAGAGQWTATQSSVHGFGAHGNAVAALDGAYYLAVDAPTGGIQHEPSLNRYDLAGVLGPTRTWEIGYDSRATALAADLDAAQLVLVGAWNVGNWIEALDADGQTLWTANEAIDPNPSDGIATVQGVALDGVGDVYVVGDENYNDGQNGWGTAYVRKLGADGRSVWTGLGLPGSGERSVAVADGTVHVVGAWPNTGLTLVARAADDGAVIWQRDIPLSPDGADAIHDLAVGPESLWLAGYRWVGQDQRAYVARVRR